MGEMDSGNQSSGRRRQALSLSLSIRSPMKKRSRVMRPPTPPPTCKEEAHYPVFNPRDPRHNPAVTTSSWLQNGYYLSQASRSQNSVRWMQSLPRRSLRKARSGLLALRSGMQRRSLPHDLNPSVGTPRIWSPSDSAEGSSDPQDDFPSSVSEASTEEDCEFGTGLYRTIRNRSSSLSGDLNKYFLDLAPPVPPMVIASPPELMDMGSCSPPSLLGETYFYTGTEKMTEDTVLRPEMSGIVSQDRAIDSQLNDYYRLKTFPRTQNWSCEPSNSPPMTPPEPIAPQITRVKLVMEPLELFDQSSVDNCKSTRSNHALHNTILEPSLRCPEASGGISLEAGNPQHAASNVYELQMPRVSDSQNSESVNVGLETQREETSSSSLPILRDTDFVETMDDVDFLMDQQTRSHCCSEEGSATELTSISNIPWSPIESDDLTSLLSLKDEFFFVDGKSSDFRPDRKDNTTKAERRIISDGSVYSGPGLDRSLSVRSQDIPEIIGPAGLYHQIQASRSGNPFRLDRDASDSTDEYLATYPIFESESQYFS